MIKKLPININPEVRTYTYHMFPNAILSAYCGDCGLIAKVAFKKDEILKYNYYNFLYNNIEIVDETIEIYGNKSNIDSKTLIRRNMNYDDECVVRVDIHKYVSSWSTINLFVEKSGNNNENNAECRVGLFSNKIICAVGNYKKCYIDNLDYDITHPYYIRISRHGSIVTGEMSINGENWDRICESRLDNDSDYLIGLEMNFGKNEYLAWLYNNYIHFVFNKNIQTHIDYVVAPKRDYAYFTFNPLIRYSSETQKFILHKYESIVEYIKKNIDFTRYIELQFDEFYIPNRDSYNKIHFIHGNLAYGYDENSIYFLGMYHGKPADFALPYNVVNEGCKSAREEYDRNMVTVYEVSPEGIEFNITLLYKSLSDYLLGIVSNIEFYNIDESSCVYGIKVFDEFESQDGLITFLSDIRIAYLIKEHILLMGNRVRYLADSYIIETDEIKSIIRSIDRMSEQANMIIGIVIKFSITKNPLAAKNISEKLYYIKNEQTKIYPRLLELIKPHINLNRIR